MSDYWALHSQNRQGDGVRALINTHNVINGSHATHEQDAVLCSNDGHSAVTVVKAKPKKSDDGSKHAKNSEIVSRFETNVDGTRKDGKKLAKSLDTNKIDDTSTRKHCSNQHAASGLKHKDGDGPRRNSGNYHNLSRPRKEIGKDPGQHRSEYPKTQGASVRDHRPSHKLQELPCPIFGTEPVKSKLDLI